MYPPESLTDPEMFYQRSTDREMAARRKRRTRVCRPMCVCVVADTGCALYEAPGVRPFQTPRIHVARSPECRAQSKGDRPLQLHGPRRTCQPFCLLLSLLKAYGLNERRQTHATATAVSSFGCFRVLRTFG